MSRILLLSVALLGACTEPPERLDSCCENFAVGRPSRQVDLLLVMDNTGDMIVHRAGWLFE